MSVSLAIIILRKSTKQYNSQSGATLVELMVVALIIILVAAIAFLNRGAANEQFQRQNASRQLKAAFERARFDSVKRRAVDEDKKANVLLTETTFTLRTDVNLNGLTTDTDDAATTTVASGITIQRYDGAAFSSSNEKVAFNFRGEVPASPAAQFLVCNGTCPAVNALTPNVADVLIITPTGTVNLLPGTPSSIPTFTNPTLVGSTSTTDNIHEDVTVP